MIEREVLGATIGDQAREILWDLLDDTTVRESVKVTLRRRMAQHPTQPELVLLEHLLERQAPGASRNPGPAVQRHSAEVWPLCG